MRALLAPNGASEAPVAKNAVTCRGGGCADLTTMRWVARAQAMQSWWLMKKSILLAVAMGISAPAFAQVRVEVGLPTIRFAAPPPLVDVEPGVQVVEGYDQEVFFVDGWYWHRVDGRWYRSRDHLGHWAAVDRGMVPSRIAAYHVGAYRNWHPVRREEHAVRRDDRAMHHDEVRKDEHDEHRR